MRRQTNILGELLKQVMENETLRKSNASNKCNDCLGRGHIEFSEPNEPTKIYLCGCVVKKIKRELKDN